MNVPLPRMPRRQRTERLMATISIRNGQRPVPQPIVDLEAFLRHRMGATPKEVSQEMGHCMRYARYLIKRAHDLGLIARVDRGFYTVHVRQYRESKSP